MSWDEGQRQQQKISLDRWADKYTARFDQALTAAWPDLVDRLQKGIDNLSLYDLTVGPGKAFSQRCIEPAVQSWVDQHAKPLINDAVAEFRDTLHWDAGEIQVSPASDVEIGRQLCIVDILKLLTVPGGVLLGGGAVATAITTTTTWLIISTIEVSWVLLVGGLVLGGVLSMFGVYSFARLKSDLQGRFKEQLLPKIKSAVVGEGIEYEGKHIPSVRDQLIRWVEGTTAAARKSLEMGGKADDHAQ